MFAYLKGMVTYKDQQCLHLEVNNMGFKVFSSEQCLSKIHINDTVKLQIYTHIKEDAFDLIGFSNDEELTIFTFLLQVSGVGVKMALALLSVAEPENIALAIASGDCKTLTRAPGVGQKLAQRIVLELKDKIAKQYPCGVTEEVGTVSFGYNDCLDALMVLGFRASDAQRAISACPPNLDTNQVIKEALKILSK